MLVVMTIPQLPEWAQPGVEQWLFDIPQYAETSDNGSIGDSSPAGLSAVPWDGYIGPESDIYGLPMIGPIQHWSTWYDKPLLGCVFHDPNYQTHTGSDFPVNEGTQIHNPWSRQLRQDHHPQYACPHSDKLHLNEVKQTVPTIGFNMEVVEYKNLKFQVWDLGGQNSIRYDPTHADSTGRCTSPTPTPSSTSWTAATKCGSTRRQRSSTRS